MHAEADRAFRLPGAGSRSLLYVFGGQQIGANAVTSDGRDLVPGSSHDGVVLTFWDDAARIAVTAHSEFFLWYGGRVGNGFVQSIGWEISE
jgi:hypothetical protein